MNADRVLSPEARSEARNVIYVDARLGVRRVIGCALRHDRGSRPLPDSDAVRFQLAVWQSEQDRQRASGPEETSAKGTSRPARRARLARLPHPSSRDRTSRARYKGFEAADNSINRFKHSDVDDCHRSGCPARPDLFAEDTVLARRNRRVIEAAAINCDFIPAKNCR